VSNPSEPDASIDSARFRQVLGHFATGVTVITAAPDGDPVGLAVGSFCSVSLDPPLVLFCPDKTSTSWPTIERAGAFCVNILAEDQEDVCRVFASKGTDKFRGIGWKAASTGSPVISDVLAWVDCHIDQVHDAGDHHIVVGRVVELSVEREGRPLLFFRGGYGRFEPGASEGTVTLRPIHRPGGASFRADSHVHRRRRRRHAAPPPSHDRDGEPGARRLR
jgi:flavin reductase (DIM6/NTAB) family NADH-FMN oxidoreductase RutF